MKRAALTLTALVLACGVAYGQQQPGPNYEHLKSYEQLVGTWVYDGPLQEDVSGIAQKGTKLLARYTWTWILDKQALEMNWLIEVEGGMKFSSKSLIGWDASEGRIVEGEMNSRGGLGLSIIAFDASTKTWTAKMEGKDAEGKSRSVTRVFTLTNPDTFQWQAKNRTGGEVSGDSPKYAFKRVKPSK